MITCEECQRTGTRGFHRVYRWKPEGQWVCDNVRACDNRSYRRWLGVLRELAS